MNMLQQFKQKGRTLRKLLAKAFDTDVTLSQAYEIVAGMEGHADWNTFSAGLAVDSSKSQAASKSPTKLASSPAIKAIFRTVDGQAEARFDVSSWFAQASKEDIRILMEEKPRLAPVGFELSYGGENGMSDLAAEFSAKFNPEIQAVYGYIAASTDAGSDCGGSDCYIDAHDVQRWLAARDANSVPESQVGLPSSAQLLANICKTTWDHAVEQWQQAIDDGVGQCAYVIEDSFICKALTDYNVKPTDPKAGYSKGVVELVLDMMENEGYILQARRIFKGLASVSAPYPQAYHPFKGLEVMMQDVVGDYNVPEEIPEWSWVQENASFSHRDNGEDGVWDYIVNVALHENDAAMPERLKPLFETARKENAHWVLFHQGT
jgi:hypothetical protein